MQIVIDIPKDKYDWIMRHLTLDLNFKDCKITPLPEPHGDLVDRNYLIKKIEKCIYRVDKICADDIYYASTIVPATKEKRCEDCVNWNEHYGTIDCMDCQNRSLWTQNTIKEG